MRLDEELAGLYALYKTWQATLQSAKQPDTPRSKDLRWRLQDRQVFAPACHRSVAKTDPFPS